MPVICSEARGTVNMVRQNGSVYEAFVYEHMPNCDTVEHRILDNPTWNEVVRFSDFTTDQIIAALFPTSEVLATFTSGFIVIFGFAALAYNIKVAINVINKV